MKKLAKKTKSNKTKENGKTSTKTKTSKPTKQQEKALVLAQQKSQAVQVIANLSKGDVAFGNSWRVFHSSFNKVMGTLEEYQKYLEEKKNATLQLRNQLLETMRHIVPKIKTELGEQGSKAKIAYVLAQNIDGAEFRHLSMLKRLLDRYEELFGELYKRALPDNDKETVASTPEGHSIHVKYETFEKGKEEFTALIDAIKTAIDSDQFEELVIRINARGEFRGFKLVVK